MKFIQQLELLDRLDGLIHRRSTGTPAQLARRLNVSERTVYNLLDAMRALGAEVTYCRERQSYFYEYRVRIQLEAVRV